MIHKIPAYWLMRRFGSPKTTPINLTVSITYRCNSRCLTCNIWNKKGDELTAEEFSKIFKSIGKVYWTTLSGGEPFLRDDITPICKHLYDNCKPKIINIPTNGILENIPERVSEIAAYCSGSKIIVNLSLDGVGSKHDEIRGVSGNFNKTINTFRRLMMLKKKHENLTVGFHTVLSKYNAGSVPELFNYIKTLEPDSYILEIAEERQELGTIGSGITPSIEEYSKATDLLNQQTKNTRFSGVSKITQAFRREYYQLAKKTLENKKQTIPCYAGFASGQIAPNGDVWFCCVKALPVGNLRENNYDFRKIWFSEKADELRKPIKNKECFCPLANAAYTNMLANPTTMIKVSSNLLK